MTSINKEWEEALRWIASWDEAVLHQGLEMSKLQGLSKVDEAKLWQQAYSTVLDDRREDFTSFVDDLARLLEACIDTCLKNEEFDLWRIEENSDESNAVMSIAGNLITRSFFSWIFGDSLSLPFRIPFEKTDLVHPGIKFVFSRGIRLVVASVAAYAVHSIWNGSPLLLQWYDFFRCKEDNSPAWLIEHEKEVEMAKKSRQRKISKKSKRKGLNKKQLSQQNTPKTNTIGKKSTDSPDTVNHSGNSQKCDVPDVPREYDGCIKDSNSCQESYYNHPQTHAGKEDESIHRLNTGIEDGIDDFDGVPSSISISTVSNTVHSDDRNLSDSPALDESTPLPSPSHHLLQHQSRIMISPTRKQLPVPTQEQRNEAAQRLRDFQNAQIQRLLYQKKLSRSLNVSSHSTTTSESPPSTLLSSPATKLLRPPPGFAHHSGSHITQDLQEDNFFADNELLLSKLLDDDDNIDDNLSKESGLDSFPHESSLDPSAAPFVLEGFNAKDDVTSSMPRSGDCDSKWELYRSPSLSSENGRAKMKGVYGGSVW